MTLPSPDFPLPPLPPRDPAGHKGTFGTVAVVGGCAQPGTRMVGAPALAAVAALRAGAGLARLVMPSAVLDAGLTIAPSATGRPLPTDATGAVIPHEAAAVLDEMAATCTCLAIGPGLGRGEGPRAASLRAVQQDEVPVVVDADAINNLAEIPELGRDLRAAAVLTPHPGEFRRLTQAMGLKDALGLDRSREAAAEGLAQRLGCIVVLKGSGTVVSDGVRTWTNSTGHACLATGGTGDVLTGVIAGIVAQFVAPPPPPGLPDAVRAKFPRPPGRPLDLFDAVRLAVHAHGLAAERWAASRSAAAGMLAIELADEIPAALESLRAANP